MTTTINGLTREQLTNIIFDLKVYDCYGFPIKYGSKIIYYFEEDNWEHTNQYIECEVIYSINYDSLAIIINNKQISLNHLLQNNNVSSITSKRKPLILKQDEIASDKFQYLKKLPDNIFFYEINRLIRTKKLNLGFDLPQIKILVDSSVNILIKPEVYETLRRFKKLVGNFLSIVPNNNDYFKFEDYLIYYETTNELDVLITKVEHN